MTPPNSREASPLPYVPALDGIRALAIGAVLVFHVSPSMLRGGFTGVDVFFVLSGFLITKVLLGDIAHERLSLREFYLRRIQRLLPNIIATVLAVVALWWFFMLPSAAQQTAEHGLWSIVNLSNFFVWKELGGYWGDAAEAAPLTHLWSLGVEEQFYLVFPVCLALLARRSSRQVAMWLGVATAASFAACVYATQSAPTAAFYLLPTRLWELLVGALVAVRRTGSARAPSARNREVLGWLGLLAILGGYGVIDEGRGFPGPAALLPTLGTALLILAVVDGETHVGRALSHPALVRTGLLSYSLYLWHWPLIIFGRTQARLRDAPEIVGAGIGAVASVVVAAFVYSAVERPLRQRGPGRERRLAVIGGGFALAALASGGLALRATPIDPDDRFAPVHFSGKLFDAGRTANHAPPSSTRYADVAFARPEARVDEAWRSGGVVHRYGVGDPEVVVLGSSQALMYGRLIDELCREHGVSVAFLTVDEGAPAFFNTGISTNFPTLELGREFDAARRQWLRDWRPDTVFVIDRWDHRARDPRRFTANLRGFLAEVSPLAERIAFVAQVPVIAHAEDVNLREFALWRAGADGSLPTLAPDAQDAIRRKTASIAEAAVNAFPKLRVLRPDRAFYRSDGSVRYSEGPDFYYADDDHLSDAGSEAVRAMFEESIAQVPARRSSRDRPPASPMPE